MSVLDWAIETRFTARHAIGVAHIDGLPNPRITLRVSRASMTLPGETRSEMHRRMAEATLVHAMRDGSVPSNYLGQEDYDLFVDRGAYLDNATRAVFFIGRTPTTG